MVSPKDINRLQQILTVLVEEGLGYYVTKAKLSYHLPFKKRIKPALPSSDKERQAIRIRKSFERLGPTFIKLGQLLSLRPDLVPKEYSKEFEKLQDKVPPFSYNQVKKIVEEDFKKPISKVFKSFEEKPFASASISQVHKAFLKSGQEVAVKIQRPNVKKIIDADLGILFHLAKALEKHFKEARKYHPSEVIKEFALWTRNELNFKVEANNAIRLKEELKNNKKVKVAKIYLDYTTERVLTMEMIKGVKMNDLAALKKYHLSKKKIVMTYFTSILEQALLKGLFHADPHPANIFVQKNGKLVYLDYGIMGELKPEDRRKIVKFVSSIDDRDPKESMDIIISLTRDTSKADLPAFRKEAMKLLKDTYESSIGEKSFAHAFYQVIALGTKHGIVFDPNHVLAAKAIYQAEGLSLELDPKFKIAEGMKVFSKEYLQEKLSPTKIISSAKKTLIRNKDLLVELPEHLARIIKKLEQPEPPQQLNISQLQEIEKEFEFIQRRKNMGMMITALIISTIILFYLEGRTEILGIPISLVLFVMTGIFGAYFVFSSRKKKKKEE